MGWKSGYTYWQSCGSKRYLRSTVLKERIHEVSGTGFFRPAIFQPARRAGCHSHPRLIVDGQSNHAWRLTTPVLKKVLDETGFFETDIATSPRKGGDFSGFRPEFAKYQVVVMNYNNDGNTLE